MLRHRIEKVLIVSGSFLILIKFELFYNNNRIDLSWLSVMCIYILFWRINFVHSNEFQITSCYLNGLARNKRKPCINVLLLTISCNDYELRSEKPQGREQRREFSFLTVCL